jgi:outer membrane protein TolC
MFYKKYILLISIIELSFLIISSCNSQPLDELLKKILKVDESITSSKYLVKKANNDLSSTASLYAPKLNLTLPVGKEVLVNNDVANTDYDFYEFSAKLTQNIYDFGATKAKYNKAKNKLDIAKVSEENTKSNKIYEAISAYLGYMKAYNVLNYAKKSEKRIRSVTNLENEKVARGAGLASNVLQSKAKLAGAKATSIRFEGDLSIATNRFYNIFRELPSNFKSFKRPNLPLNLLPYDEAEAIKLAKQNNISLNLSRLNLLNADSSVKGSKSKFFPTIKAIAELKNKRNVSGLDGTEIDQTYKLEMKYPISIGGPYGLFFKENADYKSSVNQYMVSKYGHNQLERNLEESIRNAWQTKNIAKKNYEYLSNQANISGEFFDLAMKEVKLGNRQLIDILSSETAFINSKSSAETAKTKYELSVYQLLLAMGTLKESLFINKESSNNKKKEQNKLDLLYKVEKNNKYERKQNISKEIKVNNIEVDQIDLIKVPSKLATNEKQNKKGKPKEIIINSIEADQVDSIKVPSKLATNEKQNKKGKPEEIIINSSEADQVDSIKVSNNVVSNKKNQKKSSLKINKNFKVQLGAFSKINNAELFLDKLKNDFTNNIIFNLEIDNNASLYKVKSLENYTKFEANKICNKLITTSYKCILSKI